MGSLRICHCQTTAHASNGVVVFWAQSRASVEILMRDIGMTMFVINKAKS